MVAYVRTGCRESAFLPIKLRVCIDLNLAVAGFTGLKGAALLRSHFISSFLRLDDATKKHPSQYTFRVVYNIRICAESFVGTRVLAVVPSMCLDLCMIST